MARSSSSLPGRRTNLTLLGISQILLVVQFVFLISSQSSMATKYKDFNERGTIKNAWPEYRGMNVTEVKELLEAQGVQVQVEEPRDGSPPFYAGKPDGVWLYTDGNGHVVGIPSRGLWHFNRVQPGWPDLVGIAFEKAAEIITQEQIGVKVVYGPKGFPRTKDYSLSRVFLDVDKYGNVALTPKLG